MSELITEVNKCLKENGLSIQLGIEQENRFRRNNYGLNYDSSETVRAVFQLMEREKVIVQHPIWATFLGLIQDEFGSRFMRETGLDKLVFPKCRDND